jgi:Rod binding domain-containing protein
MSQITMASMAHADPKILTDGSLKKTDSPEKIKDAAQQFEGLLLSQILSSIHEDGGWLGSGSDSSSGAATSFAEQQLAAMIAQKGGLGLAGMISAGLQRQDAGSSAPPVNSPDRSATPPSRP